MNSYVESVTVTQFYINHIAILIMSSKSYRNDIQGLRAIAVLSVIIFHINKDWLPGGFVGVDMFFVISGFLISSIILKKKQSNNFSIVEFYSSRIRRILPAYLFLLFVTLFIMVIILVPRDFQFFYDSFLKSIYFYSNNYFSNFGDYFAPDSHELPLLHTWSLSIEMQFYLILPFLMMLFSREKFIYLSIGILLISVFYVHYQVEYNDNEQVMYFSLLSRSGEFLIGSLVACSNVNLKNSIRSNALAIFGVVLISSSILFLNKDDVFPGLLAIPVCLGTALIISTRTAVNKVLSHPSLVFIGAISYSLYLWHWPVLSAVRYYSNTYLLDVDELILFATLTITLSIFSYYFIEGSFRSKNSSNKSLILTVSFIVFFSGFIYSSIYINSNIVDTLQKKYTRYAAPTGKICHGTIIGDCLRGDINSDNEILVLGDSHAAQLNYFFDVIGKSQKKSFKVVTASNCVTIPNFDYTELPKYSQDKCKKQIKYTRELEKDAKTIILAGHWVYQTTNKNFTKRLNRFLENTGKQDKRVIILSQVPLFKSNILRLNRFEQLGLPLKIERDGDWIKANSVIKEIANHYENVEYLEFADLQIFRDAPYSDTELIYSDKSHLNEVGAVKYGEAVKELIDF